MFANTPRVCTHANPKSETQMNPSTCAISIVGAPCLEERDKPKSCINNFAKGFKKLTIC
ncbi:hypothetical protein OK016_18070 [Vibrio chagasii]|nr:hypothetical protein [Vibrio chagasii]